MRQFDWKRFRMMLLWTYGNNKGNLLRMGVIMTIAFFLCEEFVAGVTLSNSWDDDIDFVGGIMLSFCCMVGLTCFYFGASTMFSCTRHKRQATAFLMHPASNMEKYLSRWIYVTVGWGIVITLAFLAADCLRMIFNTVMGWSLTSSILSMLAAGPVFQDPGLMWFISSLPADTVANIVLMVTAMMWTHSFYILGSAFFRRHAFLLTTIVLMFIQMALAITVATVDYEVASVELVAVGGYTAAAFVLALTIFNYWASYRLFRHTNVINNKWINI